MGNIGGGEILVILLVALIFLGPEKLPEVARQVGKVMGEVRKISNGFQREIQDAMRVPDDPKPGASPSISSEPPVDNLVIEAAATTALADDGVDLTKPPQTGAAGPTTDHTATDHTATEVTDIPAADIPAAEVETGETEAAETEAAETEAADAEPAGTEPGAAEPTDLGANGHATVEGSSFADVVTPPEAPPLPTDVAHGGDR
jgi:sec-independent protein translocase protein TatB